MSDPNAHLAAAESHPQDPTTVLFQEARICVAEILGETGGGAETVEIVNRGVADLVGAVLAASRAGLPDETINFLVYGAFDDPAPYNPESDSYR